MVNPEGPKVDPVYGYVVDVFRSRPYCTYERNC